MVDQTIYITYPNTSKAFNTACPEAHIASHVIYPAANTSETEAHIATATNVFYPVANVSELVENDGSIIRIPTQRITAVVERTQAITAIIEMEPT